MQFTEEEQRAIVKTLDHLIRADDFIHIDEVNYLEEIMDAYNISSKHLMTTDAYSIESAIKVVEQLTPQKKNLFMGMVYGQADSDHVVRPEEQVFIEYLKEQTITK